MASDLFLKSGEPLRAAEITIKGKAESWQDALAVIIRRIIWHYENTYLCF